MPVILGSLVMSVITQYGRCGSYSYKRFFMSLEIISFLFEVCDRKNKNRKCMWI